MMGIEDLKKALRQVRDICARQQLCADCPLRGNNNGCPTRDSEDESTDYPENWSLDWSDDGAQGQWTESVECSECGELALYNGNKELVRSRFCPHCGATMDEGAEK